MRREDFLGGGLASAAGLLIPKGPPSWDGGSQPEDDLTELTKSHGACAAASVRLVFDPPLSPGRKIAVSNVFAYEPAEGAALCNFLLHEAHRNLRVLPGLDDPPYLADPKPPFWGIDHGQITRLA